MASLLYCNSSHIYETTVGRTQSRVNGYSPSYCASVVTTQLVLELINIPIRDLFSILRSHTIIEVEVAKMRDIMIFWTKLSNYPLYSPTFPGTAACTSERGWCRGRTSNPGVTASHSGSIPPGVRSFYTNYTNVRS